ncbi:DUF2163 domain-containing protein [Celeribacter arenosi]|uniref:DUF2163 domain-containing protein n=1 Tax=Celeribacter arenosi TaxID=792649 RepID=A0ABP7KDA1_9RHOB
MPMTAELKEHLSTGTTKMCRCWAVTRRDGGVFGFTDHDRDLNFEGIVFKADTGLSAGALEQSTGLSVDNTEALGALSSASVDEGDLIAGRFDGAVVRAWFVNWADVEQRVLEFHGTFGEITRSGGAFRAELRSLTEALNQPQGRIYQPACTAVLGGVGCGFDLDLPGYSCEIEVEKVEGGRLFMFSDLSGFDDRWFERGKLVVLTGHAAGMTGMVKNDRLDAQQRTVELWESLGDTVVLGDSVRIEAGCDRRHETCRLKFDNFLNFRGFPHIPGDDWLAAYPASDGTMDGGSLKGNNPDDTL